MSTTQATSRKTPESGKKKASGGRQRAAERTGVMEIMEIEELKEMAAGGMSREQVAHYYGVSERRLNQIFASRPDFKEAFSCGLSKGIQIATKALMDKIKSGSTVEILFYLKCRAGWCEEQYKLKTKETEKGPEIQIYLPDNNRNKPIDSIEPIKSIELTH